MRSLAKLHLSFSQYRTEFNYLIIIHKNIAAKNIRFGFIVNIYNYPVTIDLNIGIKG